MLLGIISSDDNQTNPIKNAIAFYPIVKKIINCMDCAPALTENVWISLRNFTEYCNVTIFCCNIPPNILRIAYEFNTFLSHLLQMTTHKNLSLNYGIIHIFGNCSANFRKYLLKHSPKSFRFYVYVWISIVIQLLWITKCRSFAFQMETNFLIRVFELFANARFSVGHFNGTERTLNAELWQIMFEQTHFDITTARTYFRN